MANVGTARRIMMDTAHRRFTALQRPNGVICTTDADTIVHTEWVHHILESMNRGARAVGGRITAPHDYSRGQHGYRRHHLQDVTYRSLQYCLESIIDPDPADPWPRHFQHFGPSIAVQADAYAACGGIPPLSSLEDVALVQALERVDIPITHNPRVRVTTSSRVSHRVAGTAFSHQLDAWAELDHRRAVPKVMGLPSCLCLFKSKVALRRALLHQCFEGSYQLSVLTASLGITESELVRRGRSATSFGALYQPIRVALEQCPAFCRTPIDRAIRELRVFTRSQRHHGAGTHPVGTDRLWLPVFGKIPAPVSSQKPDGPHPPSTDSLARRA